MEGPEGCPLITGESQLAATADNSVAGSEWIAWWLRALKLLAGLAIPQEHGVSLILAILWS